MAAGLVKHTVLLNTGEEREVYFWALDDAAPNDDLYPVRVMVNDAGNPVAYGSGANGATVPRVALATDSPGVTALGQTTKAASLPVTIASDQDPAHDAADSTTVGPKITARAIAGLNGATLVAAADRTNLYAGLDGALIVRPHCGLEDIVSGNASNTDGASTEVIAAAAAGIKQYLTKVILTNMSASNIYVEMKSATTVKATIPLPANSGAAISFDPPLPPNAAAEAWNFDPSAAATTVYCTAVGFKSKV